MEKLKGVIVPYEKLLKDGFDFNTYLYKANVIFKDGDNVMVFEGALVLSEMVIMINADKTSVFIMKPSENKDVVIQRVDEIHLN